MRLVKLHARGFKRLLDAELDLDHDRLLVVGANEAGKSTLMEALVTGLYGLSPTRRGSGHAGSLKQVLPWTGEPAGLCLIYDLDDGRRIEVDWDLSGERTRVIDHSSGKDISSNFPTGTHGWLDIGDSLLHLPGTVFAQVTCVGEGELARITDGVQVRQSLLRVTDAGVDVLVEQALGRLEEAGRQASIPKVNSATRRNQLARRLASAEEQLAAANRLRDSLQAEVETIARTEQDLRRARKVLTDMVVEEERRQAERSRLSNEVERARGRLAEAELRLSSLPSDRPSTDSAESGWTDGELERARQKLAAGVTGPTVSRPPLRVLGPLGVGVVVLVAAIALHLVLFEALGAVLVAVGVYLATRETSARMEDIKIGRTRFRSRQDLMAAIERERARRDHQEQLAAVARLRHKVDWLVQKSSPQQATSIQDVETAPLADLTDNQLERRSYKAGEDLQRLNIELAQQRASLERGARLIPEVSPLEESVLDLRHRVDHLDQFGAACRMAAQGLAEAAEEIRRAYAPRLQAYLARDLRRITDGRYVEALVSDRFDILVRAPETGSMVDLRHLSRGTQQQIYLLLRLGLLEVMGGDIETLPLFLDDALALADDDRRSELLKVLEGEQRQLVYFTSGEAGAATGFGPQWHRLTLPRPARQELEGLPPAGALPVKVVADRSA
jgi:DNA repair exonuclease SbcCD ATPase subunit